VYVSRCPEALDAANGCVAPFHPCATTVANDVACAKG
jgi:hypothetical protein